MTLDEKQTLEIITCSYRPELERCQQLPPTAVALLIQSSPGLEPAGESAILHSASSGARHFGA